MVIDKVVCERDDDVGKKGELAVGETFESSPA
jgi:hypothetical protein